VAQRVGRGIAVLFNDRGTRRGIGSEGSRKFRFPDFTTTAQDDDKVVSLTHRLPLPPGNVLGTHFC